MTRHRDSKMAIVAVILLLTQGGCSSAARQQAEIANWEKEAAELGHPEIKHKTTLDANKALALSFAPFGLAGFYVHRPGLGVTGILFWPLSILWTAPQAASSVRNYDYEQFRRQMMALRMSAGQNRRHLTADEATQRLRDLETLWKTGKISDGEYQSNRQKVLSEVAQ